MGILIIVGRALCARKKLEMTNGTTASASAPQPSPSFRSNVRLDCHSALAAGSYMRTPKMGEGRKVNYEGTTQRRRRAVKDKRSLKEGAVVLARPETHKKEKEDRGKGKE